MMKTTFDKEVSFLVMRTMKLKRKHDLNYNDKIVPIIIVNKDLFLENNSILKMGIYGSFSTGSTNE